MLVCSSSPLKTVPILESMYTQSDGISFILNGGFGLFFSLMSKQLGISNTTAVEIILNSNHNLKEYFNNICEQHLLFQKEAAKVFKVSPNNLKVLSSELHLNGSHVLYFCEDAVSGVIYSSRRAINPVFHEICVWYSGVLGLERFSRGRNICSTANFTLRPYIHEHELKDLKKASQHAGALVALCQYFAITDIHSNNVIFSNDVPIIIDDECLCQPVRQNQIKELKKNRSEYPKSIYRSLLIFDPFVYKANKLTEPLYVFGLQRLFDANVDEKYFLDGYKNGLNTLVRHKAELTALVLDNCKLFPWVRYLVRSTKFYETLQKMIAFELFSGHSLVDIKHKLNGAFVYEKNKFPELNSCIKLEIEALLNGNIPYCILNLFTGDICLGSDSATSNQLEEKPLSWLIKHIDSMSQASLKNNLSDIQFAIQQYSVEKNSN